MGSQIQSKPGKRLELTYLHGGEFMYHSGEKLGPRFLADYELVYVIDGSIVYSVDNCDYDVPPGGFVLGRPGYRESYYWDPNVPTRHAFFHFEIKSYPSDWPSPSKWPRVRPSMDSLSISLFRRIIEHTYQHPEWPDTAPDRSTCGLVESLLDTFLEKQQISSNLFEQQRPEAVNRALLLMRKTVEISPSSPLSLAELAAEAHVTEKHLCRLFSKSLTRSPMQTFIRLKLESARLLLMRSNLSIKEIAERCGFEDPLYFSRRFGKTFGCSPTAFRKQFSKGIVSSSTDRIPPDLMPRIRW